MSLNAEERREQRRAWIAAGRCGNCSRFRGSDGPGRATPTQCGACAERSRAAQKKFREKRIMAGRCKDCGKRDPGSPVGGTLRSCRECAAALRLSAAKKRREQRFARTDVFGPAPTGEPGFVGRGAKPLGRSMLIQIRLNSETIEAINVLKRRYCEANPGKRWKYHVSEIARDALAGVLKKQGPLNIKPDRICVRGWHFTFRIPITLYQQITHVAKQRFDGSRARAIRAALLQAVEPPFVAASGGRRVLGGTRRYEWDV